MEAAGGLRARQTVIQKTSLPADAIKMLLQYIFFLTNQAYALIFRVSIFYHSDDFTFLPCILG